MYRSNKIIQTNKNLLYHKSLNILW